jgi:hypothetical protein
MTPDFLSYGTPVCYSQYIVVAHSGGGLQLTMTISRRGNSFQSQALGMLRYPPSIQNTKPGLW